MNVENQKGEAEAKVGTCVVVLYRRQDGDEAQWSLKGVSAEFLCFRGTGGTGFVMSQVVIFHSEVVLPQGDKMLHFYCSFC